MEEDDEKKLKKTDENKNADSKEISIGSKKTIETYKKQIKAISPQYSQTLKQVNQSLKAMDISNKIALATPKMLSTNTKIANMLKSYEAQIKLPTVIGEIAKQQMAIYNSDFMQQITNSMSSVISQIAEVQRQLINTISETIAINITPALESLANSLEQAKKNPDSLLSWSNYYNKMSEFFWIMPYKITTEELHEILENVTTEKEFDKYISNYFNKEKVELLISDINGMLSNANQRKIFNQIVIAYKNKSYALASIGITTMIDNFLSYYLIDKGCTSRLKLFEPIIKDLDLKRVNSDFSYIVMMVNSNINLLYEQIEFNNKISINTNKKSRRNPISHGKSYSYKKIDTIMLLNTMYYLLVIQNELKQYKNSLYRNSQKKEFYIPSKDKKKEIIKKIKNKETKK